MFNTLRSLFTPARPRFKRRRPSHFEVEVGAFLRACRYTLGTLDEAGTRVAAWQFLRPVVNGLAEGLTALVEILDERQASDLSEASADRYNAVTQAAMSREHSLRTLKIQLDTYEAEVKRRYDDSVRVVEDLDKNDARI